MDKIMKAKCEELANKGYPVTNNQDSTVEYWSYEDDQKQSYKEGFTAAVELMEASTVPVSVVEELVESLECYRKINANDGWGSTSDIATEALADYEAWKGGE